MQSDGAGGSHLEWGIKESLITYVRDMPDGVVSTIDPATETATGFRFAASTVPAAAAELRFSGTVTLTGHSGMLRIVIADPWLEPLSTGQSAWLLTIADPFAPGARLEFASLGQVTRDATGSLVGSGTELTAAGSELFLAGPYAPGTLLADPVVREIR
ncbi:HtaA domain-containing protein [Leucobacter luti]|uniref:HtaA domain-containing protein n=1 Tax=Leucobacter luti TaxID=340320 RepID=UPI0010500A3B|nr:HtaA domain-containing protein [Leucobacter luti]MCW2289935.1 hypothetical protein [Leucobacter luti]